MKELLEILKTRAAHPELPYALATVVRVEGSSYRKPGARMLIGALGRLAGSVSGGCLEKDVISRGLAVILSGEGQLAVYDTTDQDDLAFGTSLGCQGRIEILIEPVSPGQTWPLSEVVEAILQHHRAAAMATVYRGDGGAANWTGQMLVVFSEEGSREWGLAAASIPGLREDLLEVRTAKRARAQAYEVPGGRVEVLLERIAPPLPLMLFGGGHDVPPLVKLAKELGHHVTVVDRRIDFAEPQRFPGADRVVHARPADVLTRVPVDEGSAAVIMNHHYETDSELLGLLLGTSVAYLGMLGPRKRTGKILQELRDSGLNVTEAQMEKLHAPAGLDLGCENPEQIALSILAEIQATMSGRSAVNLRSGGPSDGRPFRDDRAAA